MHFQRLIVLQVYFGGQSSAPAHGIRLHNTLQSGSASIALGRHICVRILGFFRPYPLLS